MRYVFLGKPGSGKGSQASRLAERLSLPHLSSGQILRGEIAEGSPFGLKVKEYVLRGEIGPGDLIASLILDFMERKGYGNGYILDGFPRTVGQAMRLDGKYPPRIAILLDLEDEVVLHRLTGRLNCTECGAVYHGTDDPPRTTGSCDKCGLALEKRDDDRKEAISRRLETFRDESGPVIGFYEERGRLLRIDAADHFDTVFTAILEGID